jgi:hypothetical protein
MSSSLLDGMPQNSAEDCRAELGVEEATGKSMLLNNDAQTGRIRAQPSVELFM